MKTDVQKKSSENKKLKVKINQKKERIAWIDIAKGVTILTVIWSHTLPFGGLPRNLIFCFHMPLFFILSGFTLKPAKDVKDLVLRTKKDFIRLVVPAFLIVVVGGLLNVLILNSQLSAEISDCLYKLFWANGVPLADGSPSMGMIWFLVSLFFAKLIMRTLSLLFKDGYELIGILCGFVGLTLNVKHIWLPFNFDMALVCAMFVAGGILACKYYETLVKYKPIIFIVSSIFVYQMLLGGKYIEFAGHSYDVFTILEGFAASFIVCAICKSIESINIVHKVFCFIGMNTMPIFLTHHLDGFISFLFIRGNVYISCILRTFYVLLFAFIFAFIYRWCKKKIIEHHVRSILSN